MRKKVSDYPKGVSKQRRWQVRKEAEGKCALCGKPICQESVRYCQEHLESNRKRARERYRLKNGIPADAPLLKSGRPKGVVKKQIALIEERIDSRIPQP